MLRSLFLLVVGARQVVLAQLDPIDNFCRRIDTQSTLINGNIYIDGGRAVFTTYDDNGKDIGPRIQGNNQYLISIDVTQSWDWRKSLPQKIIPKVHEATTDVPIPAMSRGALYPDPTDPNKFWLFGGATATDNTTFTGYQLPQPEAWSLWSYQIDTDLWTGYDMSSSGIHKPASGPTAYVQDKGLAVWFNGMQDKGSAAETTVLDTTTRFLDGMVIVDLKNQTARNVSTAAVGDLARVRGGMVHVPLAGSDGIIVLLGGGEKSSADLTHDWKGTLVDLSTVDILDVASLSNASTPDGVWYKQTTTGVTPKPRLDSCFVVASAPDNSSHNIIMYGGRDGLNGYYDETWILTIPSFQWKLVNSGTSPRYSMTCHVAGNRQMITTGGSDTSNLTAGCDWHTRGVGVLDMSAIAWASTYDAAAKPYVVPGVIVAMIGGTPEGNATKVEPVSGFSDPGLKQLFHPSSKSSVPGSEPSSSGTIADDSAPTSSGADGSTTSASKKHTSIGAIAGGIIGVLLVLAAILGLILFLLRRKKQQNKQEQQVPSELEATYKDHPVLDSAPVYEKSGISATTTELSAGRSSMSSDGKKGYGPGVVVEPVEMEGSNVLGVVAFSAPPSPDRESVAKTGSVHQNSANGRSSPLP